MGKIFNIAGPCNPGKHYMLPAMARLGREALARGHRLARQDRAPVPMLVNFNKGRKVGFTGDVAGCCDRYARFLALSSKT